MDRSGHAVQDGQNAARLMTIHRICIWHTSTLKLCHKGTNSKDNKTKVELSEKKALIRIKEIQVQATKGAS